MQAKHVEVEARTDLHTWRLHRLLRGNVRKFTRLNLVALSQVCTMGGCGHSSAPKTSGGSCDTEPTFPYNRTCVSTTTEGDNYKQIEWLADSCQLKSPGEWKSPGAGSGTHYT